MKIGELARRTDVGIDTVRYYEQQGLMRPASRMPSGYRLFDEEDVSRLHFIRRAKALGFTLTEIRELLALSDNRDDDMASLKAAAQDKLRDVEQRMLELARVRDGLRTLVDACPGHGALKRCPILNALAEERA